MEDKIECMDVKNDSRLLCIEICKKALKQIVNIGDVVYAKISFNSLTLGKEYTILNVYFDSVVITDDNGDAFAYHHSYFTFKK